MRVCCPAIAEWSNRELIYFGRICNFPEEALSWLQAKNYDGQKFGRLKDPHHLAVCPCLCVQHVLVSWSLLT